MLCGYCGPRNLKCWAKEGHKKCAQCTRRGRPCDGKGVTLLKGCRLEQEEEIAENDILSLQQQMNERLSRLMHLRRQKKQL
ncbi:uncharacterized protein FTOL_13796 [Fusarium torulosum]|uniref:Uncharacterized protein n=1 Tax=Fusarium torulosum TaxID=33205 RepID=A0AAE8MN03_9HYPO|nr:uncharacterized protein FTOL_13796 [Fusarium torulosum]